jgi:hypothetical protein
MVLEVVTHGVSLVTLRLALPLSIAKILTMIPVTRYELGPPYILKSSTEQVTTILI